MDNNLFRLFGRGKKEIRLTSNDCVIYTRVSGIKQMDGLSLETQLKGTKQFAERNKLIVREHFGGTYESAQTDERKEFQRMIKFIKTSKYRISKILVYSLERFSRNENSIWLASQLRKLGTEIVSVTQPIDTSNPAGQMQQKMLFLFGEFDNQLRKQKCMAGTRERLMKGEWCAKPPIGYDIVRKNGERKIVVNETGKILRKIFYWKDEEKLNNEEIRKRLLKFKLNFNLRRIGDTLTNPFYCGMIAHKALEGEVIEGKHEKLISKELFLRVNNLMQAKKLGLQTKKEDSDISLKRFMICDECKQPMRGYITKQWNLHYYKCNTPGCKCNRKAEHVHEKFLQMVSSFQIDPKYHALIRYQMKETFSQINASIEETQRAAKAQISDLNRKLERLEERYILEEITGELYVKYKAKFEAERDEIEATLTKTGFELSKFDGLLDFTLNLAGSLSEMWTSSDYTGRQKLQYLLFPQGIIYNKIKDECRSEKENSFLRCIADVSRDLANLGGKNSKNPPATSLGSS